MGIDRPLGMLTYPILISWISAKKIFKAARSWQRCHGMSQLQLCTAWSSSFFAFTSFFSSFTLFSFFSWSKAERFWKRDPITSLWKQRWTRGATNCHWERSSSTAGTLNVSFFSFFSFSVLSFFSFFPFSCGAIAITVIIFYTRSRATLKHSQETKSWQFLLQSIPHWDVEAHKCAPYQVWSSSKYIAPRQSRKGSILWSTNVVWRRS